MNKKELIRAISRELDPPMSQDKITLILDKAVEITKRTLADGEPVKWAGFGSFVMKDVLPRLFYSTPVSAGHDICTINKDARRLP